MINIANWSRQVAEFQWCAVLEGITMNVCGGWRKEDCFYWFAVIESRIPNAYKIGRQSDESQGITSIESLIFNACDGIRYCDPQKGFTTLESPFPDGTSNGRMKVDFRGIFRGIFTTEAPISVDGGCEVRNDLRWQVSTEEESTPTFILINPRDCEDTSLHFTENLYLPQPPMILGSITPPACGSCTSKLLVSLLRMCTIIMAINATAGSSIVEWLLIYHTVEGVVGEWWMRAVRLLWYSVLLFLFSLSYYCSLRFIMFWAHYSRFEILSPKLSLYVPHASAL